MPSWNIHVAQVEGLFGSYSAEGLGIRSIDEYLLGNLVPDIYVGYMVGDVSHTYRYSDTHYADISHVPVPDADKFWDDWISPYIEDGGVSDIILGTWAHLTADNLFNFHVKELCDKSGIEPGKELRIRKQNDFDLYGHLKHIHTTFNISNRLIKDAENFCQYQIDECDVYATKRSLEKIIEESNRKPKNEDYLLLDYNFIDKIFNEVLEKTVDGLYKYVNQINNKKINSKEYSPLRKWNRPNLEIGPCPAVLFKDDSDAASMETRMKEIKN